VLPDVIAKNLSILSAAASAVGTGAEPWSAHDGRVLVAAAIGIGVVIGAVVLFRLHAFLALTLGALCVGLGSGIPLRQVIGSYEAGVGGVLGYVGVLIGLGAVLGKLLADSGGADRIVSTILHGKPSALPWKMVLIAALIGVPMFFEIGLVLLIPVVMLAVQRSHAPALRLGIPALAGLSVLHGFVPPHPGPLAAIAILHANVGLTAGLGLLIALPCAIVAGPLFGALAARWVPIGAAGAALAVADGDEDAATPSHAEALARAGDPTATRTPSFVITLVTILLPLVLMLLKATAEILLPAADKLRPVLDFVGDPVFALLMAVLLSMFTFGIGVGFSAAALGRKVSASLTPIASVMFIVGAGGGLKQMLVDGGTGTAIAKLAAATSLSAILLGWIVAALIRLATGSATVATVTAAGIVAPLATTLTQAHLSLLVLAIGAGSLIFSHVNDAGFWLVKEYFGLSVGQTLKTWSVMETIVSVMGLVLTLLLSTVM
jgi:GntP family gluconate:H+ symporter